MALFDTFPAKIATPKYSEVIIRNRLFKVLDEKRQRPGVRVSAPAGAGKTTLISSYAENRNIRVPWYQLDQIDSDAATFFFEHADQNDQMRCVFAKMKQLLHQAGSYETTYWYLNNVWMNLIEGRIVDAVRNSAVARRNAATSGCRKIEPIAYLGRALALFHSREYHSAKKNLSSAIGLCETLNTRHTLFACYLAEAEMDLHRQDDNALDESLKRAP